MRYAKRVLVYQMLTIVLLTSVGLLFELEVVLMMLIGSGSSALGTGLFAVGVFGPHKTQDPNFLVQRFYIAELLKIVLIVAIFVLTFLLVKRPNLMALSGGYFATQVFATALATLQDDGSEYTN